MKKALGLALIVLGALCTASWAGVREDRLWQAVREDDHAAIKALLAQHAKPNAPLPDGSTVLAWAVDRQDEQSVKLLLAAHAKTGVLDHDGASPLMLACELGDPAIVQDLLKAGADAKATRPDGISALALCAGTSSPAALDALLAKGADVNAANPDGQTPLMWAADRGRTDNIAFLIKHGANLNAVTKTGFTALHFALRSKNADAQSLLLNAGADIKVKLPDGTSIVEAALLEKDFPFVMRLVSDGDIDLNHRDSEGRLFIHLAAASGSADLVKLVLSKGSDPNAMTTPPPPPPPPKVVVRGPTTLLPGPPMPTPVLLFAAKAGSAPAMKVLVDAGAKPDTPSADGTTLTLAAAGGGNLEALKYALQLDPNVNAVNNQGRNVMHMVVANRFGPDDPAMIAYLAEKGAKLELKDSRGVTPGLYVNVAGPQSVRVAYIQLLKEHGIVSAFHDDPSKQVAIPDPLPVRNSDK